MYIPRITKRLVFSTFPIVRKLRYRRRFDNRANETGSILLPFMNYGYAALDGKERVS